jgi:uncharacterized protein
MQNKQSMQDFVISLLKANLSEFYFYHNYEHTLYVIEKAVEIGLHEKCTNEELDLVTIAAMWHDTGYIKTYKDHEEESCKLARHYLPGYGVAAADIAEICGMIMATEIPQMPKTKLEEILADADLEYLGSSYFEVKADKLFNELQHLNPSLTAAEWNKAQISFLQKHHYFTGFCKENRESIKQMYLNKLIHDTE